MSTLSDFSNVRTGGELLAKKLLGESPKLFCLCSKPREIKVFDQEMHRYTEEIDHYSIMVGGPNVAWPFEVRLDKNSQETPFDFYKLGLGWMKPVNFKGLRASTYRFKVYFRAQGVEVSVK